ncbi:hypothetical protein L3X38_003031 [Prunus dulcis]|uniref:Pentatricopeptide repeat superfamily protein n=2 Tax=Prunus dulcis TaxID=3755 RepID=A0AAD4ZL73_PRUDU|nr:hypothetical protein L3X38_003031 [Prunus dulcis]
MESVVNLQHSHCKIALTWKINHGTSSFFFFPKTLTTKPSCKAGPFTSSLRSAQRLPSPLRPDVAPDSSSTKHTTLLVETFHEHQRLKALLQKLINGSCPLQLLGEDGDWTKDQFWAAIRFLKRTFRFNEILQLFDMWKNIEKSRINEFNYSKIIGLLGEEGLIEEAVRCFQEMKSHNLRPSLEVYNSVIHGCARQGNFDDALFFLNEMKEMNLAPETDTYDGLIEAYGKYRMYDEIGMCVKKMKLNGCSPDHITYNLLIREFAGGGLLKRMESVYQSMLSRRMALQSSSLIAMVEVYAKFGILEKMENVYRRVLNSGTVVKNDLIRKLAEVYIDNYMFSRLEKLGVDLSSRFGQTDLVWCLRLLSQAGVLSRRGMDSIVDEMKEQNVPWNETVANIIMLAYLKMKDFTHLRIFLSQLLTQGVEPDIITVGIVFDANRIGYDGSRTLDTWRENGFLRKAVEMNTDPLVLTAFGKGHFLRNCEAAYSSLEPEDRENKTWTYHHLIDLVFKHTQCSLSMKD